MRTIRTSGNSIDPMNEVSHGPRSGLRQKPGRVGPGGGSGQRRRRSAAGRGCGAERRRLHASSARTRRMSRTARKLPGTLPETLDSPPTRGAVGDRDLPDRPARRGRAQHHLQRPAEPAVAQAERQQRFARGAPHRSQIGRRRRRRAGAAPRPGPGWPAGHGRATRPAPARRAPRHNPSRPSATGGDHAASSPGSSEPSQSMKQTSSDRAAGKPGVTGRAEPAPGLDDDPGAQAARDRRRAVARPVVDDERLKAGRHRREHDRDGLGLVEHGKDDLDHTIHRTPRFLRV